jgi:hypothetical protein
MRLRQATRLFASTVPLSTEQLTTLTADDVLASRVFAGAPTEGINQQEAPAPGQ